MKHLFRSTRLRLILLVLTAVVPALILALFNGLEVRQQAAEKAQIDANRLVKISADSFNDLLVSGQQLLSGLALLPQVSQHDIPSCNVLFASMLKEFQEYTNLAVADPQGNLFCSGTALSNSVNIADRDYFQQVMRTGQFAISGYVISRETHKSTLIMAHPSLDASGKVQAVVTASLDLTILNEMITVAQLPRNSVFFIIDNQGTILARSPDSQQWVGKLMPESDIVEEILQAKTEGTAEAAGLDNIKRMYAFLPIQYGSGNSAFMAVGFPSTQVYAEGNRLLRNNLISLGVVALFSLSAAWLFGDLLIISQVKPLLHAVKAWTEGDLQVRIHKQKGPVEFVQLAGAFDNMATAISQREEQIRQAERDAVENATRIKIQQTIINQREEERLKIARDLHDGPVQEITAVTFALHDLLEEQWPAEATQTLHEIRDVLREQIRNLRNYAGELRPPLLTSLGLGKAIRSHLENFQTRHPGIDIQFDEAPEESPLPEEIQLAFFRIYQELLNNISKHSQASLVRASLSYAEGRVILEIQDNGVGFTVASDWLELASHGHLGLVGIRERANAIGGKVEILSSPGNGSLIRITAPCEGLHRRAADAIEQVTAP